MDMRSLLNLITIVTIPVFYSCESKRESQSIQSDSVHVSGGKVSLPAENNKLVELNEANHSTQPVTEEKSSGKNESTIEIKVYKNTDGNGYGYDIQVDGRIYVHQPNVPAIPGNNGFKSEREALSVAELVAGKIRNNILPPTIDVRELDSLGIH